MENTIPVSSRQKQALIAHCEGLMQSDVKRLFVDNFGQDYVVYKHAQKNGKKVLKKLFELRCDTVQVETLVVNGVEFKGISGAGKLLSMVEALLTRQKHKQLKNAKQKIAQAKSSETQTIK